MTAIPSIKSALKTERSVKKSSLIDNYTAKSYEAQKLRESESVFEEARALWTEGLKATQNEKTPEAEAGEAKFSLVSENASYIHYSVKEAYGKQVDDVLNNTFDKNNHVYMGKTPQKLVDILGIPQLPVLMTNNHVYSMAVSEQQAKSDGRYKKGAHYHDLGTDIIKALPRELEHPVAIVKSNTSSSNADFVVVTNKFDGNNNRVIVAIKPNGNGVVLNAEIDANMALSGYGKDNLINYLNKAQKENRILYVQKNSQQHNTPGLQLPNTIMSTDYGNSLAQFKRVVNSIIYKNSKNDTRTTVTYADGRTEKFSLKETVEEDLQRKYPTIDLNQDISELDGVPAIELSDGSIVPVDENHIPFIQKNKIDVDDLKSGGWIGKGAYNSSFQSDTARYIERQRARKRAEARLKISKKLSLKETSPTDSDLITENAELKEMVADLKAEFKLTKGHKVNRKSVEKLAKSVLKEYKSTYNAETLTNNLEAVFNYIARTENADGATAMQLLSDVSKAVIEASSVKDTTLYDDFKDLRDELRNTQIYINDAQKSEIAYVFDGYNEFRKKYFGSLNLSTTEGTPIDVLIDGLAERYPNFFDATASDKDQIFQIANTLDMLKPQYTNQYEMDIDGYAYDLASTLFDRYFDTPAVGSPS